MIRRNRMFNRDSRNGCAAEVVKLPGDGERNV
jgi:hypothetical protein